MHRKLYVLLRKIKNDWGPPIGKDENGDRKWSKKSSTRDIVLNELFVALISLIYLTFFIHILSFLN